MTQNDFLAGAKFLCGGEKWRFSPFGYTKGIIKTITKQIQVIEIDKEGFCLGDINGRYQRIDFADCKLIEDDTE